MRDSLAMDSISDSDPGESQANRPSLSSTIIQRYAISKLHAWDKGQRFIPEGTLEEIITKKTVTDELGTSYRPEEDGKLLTFIVEKANKVFALAILVSLQTFDLRRVMRIFHHHGFTNESLPIRQDEVPGLAETAFKSRLWTSVKILDFCDKQWELLAPIFCAGELVNTFNESHILPFERVNNKTKSGTFGAVYEVCIHSAHLDDVLYKVRPLRTTLHHRRYSDKIPSEMKISTLWLSRRYCPHSPSVTKTIKNQMLK